MSLDTTDELLDDTVFDAPSTPPVVNSVEQDDSEDEIYFGSVTVKETSRVDKRFKRRDTAIREITAEERRRSFDVNNPSKHKLFSLDQSVQLYAEQNSITEEDEEHSDEEVFADENEDPLVISTLAPLELLSIPDKKKFSSTDSNNVSHITGRRKFRKSGRSPLFSLPSASKIPGNAENKQEETSESELQNMSPKTLEDQACSEAINSDSETSFRFESVSDGNFEMGEIESTSFTDGKHVSLKPADPLASFKLCSESFGSEYSAGARNDRPSTDDEGRNSDFLIGSVCSLPSHRDKNTVTKEANESLSSLDDCDDSVFTRKSMEGDFTGSESFTLGCIDGSVGSVGGGSVTDRDTTMTDSPVTTTSTAHRDESGSTIRTPTPEIRITEPAAGNAQIDEWSDGEEIRSDPRSARRDSSVESVYFDSQLEEMILYDKYGPDYDEVVDRMSKEERYQLHRQIEAITPEEMTEIGERLRKVIQAEEDETPSVSGKESIGSNISAFSMSPATPTPLQRKSSALEERRRSRLSSISANLKKQIDSGEGFIRYEQIVPSIAVTEDDQTADDEDAQDEYNDESNATHSYEPQEEKSLLFKPSRVSEISSEPAADDLNIDEGGHQEWLHGSPGYLQHTYSSIQKMSPLKPCNPSPHKPWLPPSSPQKTYFAPLSPLKPALLPQQQQQHQHQQANSANKPQYTTPSKFGTFTKPTVQKTSEAMLQVTPSRTPSQDIAFGTPGSKFGTPGSKSGSVFKTPLSSSKKSRIPHLKQGFAGHVVASPVAEFIRNNPAPHLVQNMKAKEARELESTLIEVDDTEQKENQFPSLPCASYTAANHVKEIETDGTGKDYHLEKAYGQEQTLVKVTRHLDRARLKWDDSCLEDFDSVQSTPRIARTKNPAKGVLKKTKRDSGLFDESMMDISVHQTEVVKKLAGKKGGRGGRGGGRGRGRAKK